MGIGLHKGGPLDAVPFEGGVRELKVEGPLAGQLAVQGISGEKRHSELIDECVARVPRDRMQDVVTAA